MLKKPIGTSYIQFNWQIHCEWGGSVVSFLLGLFFHWRAYHRIEFVEVWIPPLPFSFFSVCVHARAHIHSCLLPKWLDKNWPMMCHGSFSCSICGLMLDYWKRELVLMLLCQAATI